jgi:hypothetical protein
MNRNLAGLLAVLLACVFFSLAGCGNGGSDATTDTADLTSMGWYFENTPADYSSSGACSLSVFLYYNALLAQDQIDSFIVTAPNGTYWKVPASANRFGTSSSGKPYLSGRLVISGTSQQFPLAGTWVAQLILKNGNQSKLLRTLHEPGNSAVATHSYLFSKEDWTPVTDASQYISLLDRFPAQGYSAKYSASNGGSITTTGFAAVRSSFLAAEPRAYNMYCWLYDANKVYLGYTNRAYSSLDHSSTGLISADGELSILAGSTIAASGLVDLSQAKYLRFVVLDGLQFTPTSYSGFDYRSISALVPVN